LKNKLFDLTGFFFFAKETQTTFIPLNIINIQTQPQINEVLRKNQSGLFIEEGRRKLLGYIFQFLVKKV